MISSILSSSSIFSGSTIVTVTLRAGPDPAGSRAMMSNRRAGTTTAEMGADRRIICRRAHLCSPVSIGCFNPAKTRCHFSLKESSSKSSIMS